MVFRLLNGEMQRFASDEEYYRAVNVDATRALRKALCRALADIDDPAIRSEIPILIIACDKYLSKDSSEGVIRSST